MGNIAVVENRNIQAGVGVGVSINTIKLLACTTQALELQTSGHCIDPWVGHRNGIHLCN